MAAEGSNPAPSDGAWVPKTEAEFRAVRDQSQRILGCPLFKKSKRATSLFQHIVEQTLAGRTEELKERTLGVDVFGREPSYDTGLDPVVRVTAGEIRKRIAQYYHDIAHESETRIDLPTGSYVAEFHKFGRAGDELPVNLVEKLPPIPGVRSHLWRLIGALASIVLITLVVWLKYNPPKSALDEFWQPVFNSGAVSICLGGMGSVNLSIPLPQQNLPEPYQGQAAVGNPGTRHTLPADRLNFSDAVTMSKLVSFFERQNKRYRISRAGATTLSELRTGPALLIGAYNNYWTMQLMDRPRFGFGKDAHASWVNDRQAPSKRDWQLAENVSYMQISEDYGIVARLLDPTTDQIVVVAAGLAQCATAAAGEFLTSPASMKKLAALAPPGWKKKNIEVVIATTVVSGQAGPPRILATCFW